MKTLLSTLSFLALLAVGSVIVNTGTGFYNSFIGGLSLAGAALVYGLYLVSPYARAGNFLLALSILLVVEGSYVKLSLIGWTGVSLYLFSTVLAGALLVSWIVSIGFPSTGLSDRRKVDFKGISRGIGVGIGLTLVLFSTAYLAGYLAANTGQSPVLAGKEVLLPGSLRPVKPDNVVDKIYVNPSSHIALIDFHAPTLNDIPGIFKGDPGKPVGSVIETSRGNLIVTPGLEGKLEITSKPIQLPVKSGVHRFGMTLIGSIIDTFSFLSDPKNLVITVGLTLYFIGYSIRGR